MSNKEAFLKVFRYMRPHALGFGFGSFMYSAQAYLNALINAVFMGALFAAIMPPGDFSEVISAVWLVGAMMVGMLAVVGVGTYLYVVNVAKGVRNLKTALFRAFVKSSQENAAHSGEGIAVINTDADMATRLYGDSITSFVNNLIAIGFSAVTIFAIDIRMGFGAVGVGFLIFLMQAGLSKPLTKLGTMQLEANADAVKSVTNIFAGALTIRAFSRQDKMLFAFEQENGRLRFIGFKQAFIGMWQDTFTTLQGWLSLVLVFALGGWLAATGRMEFPLIFMTQPLIMAITSAMSQFGASWADLQPPLVAAKRVLEIIESVPKNTEQKQESVVWNGNYDINISNLNFAYRDAESRALKDISLQIRENEMVAFVGESGSGKSTLLRAVIGMYDREELPMGIGNINFSASNLGKWRENFAYVDQSCKLFDMTIAENIAMGKQGDADENEIKNAAKRAFADDFINAMPDGYKTECGEKGASLSGGQKQRLAIARALCRKAPVLVFDEATSALDAESESNIMATIEDLRKDHTVLITTHNLNNVVEADKIIVMDKGLVVESGTHGNLMEKGGLYYRLFTHNTEV